MDAVILMGLHPLEVASYLRSSGWREEQRHEQSHSTWALSQSDGREYELLLPLDRSFMDFSVRMGELLQTLEVVESRSQLEILEDLDTVRSDIVRLRRTGDRWKEGSVPLEAGVQMIERGRDLLMAAACATVEPRAVYASKKPGRATEFLRNTRLGQTERGSFVLTFLSPVPPAIQSQISTPEEPFERRALYLLALSFSAVKDAVGHAVGRGTLDAFQNAVQYGVSANLCEAVVGLAGGAEGQAGLSVDLTWSRARPASREVPRRIELPSDAMPFVAEAARLFKEQSPVAGFVLEGRIVKLEREEGALLGRATVMGFVEGNPRRILLELSGPSYDEAIAAHRADRTVRCTGELRKSGGSFQMKDVRDFQVVGGAKKGD